MIEASSRALTQPEQPVAEQCELLVGESLTGSGRKISALLTCSGCAFRSEQERILAALAGKTVQQDFIVIARAEVAGRFIAALNPVSEVINKIFNPLNPMRLPELRKAR